MLIIDNASTYFGQLYAHLQEQRPRVTAYEVYLLSSRFTHDARSQEHKNILCILHLICSYMLQRYRHLHRSYTIVVDSTTIKQFAIIKCGRVS